MISLKQWLRYTIFLICVFSFFFVLGVILMIKPSKEEYQLPNFKEKRLVKVIKWLQEKNMAVYVYEKIDLNIPLGKVIHQIPAPGTPIKQGRTVILTISAGSKATIMQDYIGKDYQIAKKELYALFVGYNTIPNIVKISQYSKEIEEGHIINHSPRPGENINEDDNIVFIVSKALVTQEIKIMNYKFKNYNEISEQLIDAGIEVNVTYLPTENKDLIGKIFQQNIDIGEILTEGDKIQFTVGIEKKLLLEKKNQEIEIIRLFSFRMPYQNTNYLKMIDDLNKNELKEKELLKGNKQIKNIKLFNVRVSVSDQIGVKDVFYGEVLEGELLELPYKTIGSGVLSIFINEKLYREITFK